MSKGTGSDKTPEERAENASPGRKIKAGDDGEKTRPEPDIQEEAKVEGEAEVETDGETDEVDPASRNEELMDSLMRLKADFENYRKRMMKEQTRIVETAEADLVRKLLPVIDNLERALDNADGSESQGLREGVEMVLGQVMEVLAREGLEIINPEDEPFDPEHHEAMMVVETEECPEDTVVEVAQKGYRFRGILLRPAMVSVACPVKGQ